MAATDPLERARSLAPLLKALADERRLAILLLLADRPLTVKELQAETGMGQTLASHHLRSLRDHGLVTATPEGRSNRYSLCCDALADPLRMLDGLTALAAAA